MPAFVLRTAITPGRRCLPMDLPEGFALATVLGAEPRTGVAERIRSIRDDLLFYAEHTYGAAESISDPLAENTQVQWGEKGSYVWNAVKESHLLREELR